MWDLVQAKDCMKGCGVVVASQRVGRECRYRDTGIERRIQGRSWGSTEKNVPCFTTLSRILVVSGYQEMC